MNPLSSGEDRRVEIVDVTLSLGELVPGVSFSRKAKIEIAMSLDALGVDAIEAGFPAASEGEREAVADVVAAVKRVSRRAQPMRVLALARAKKEDVEAAFTTNVDGVNVFMPVSDVHLEKRLKISRDEAKARVAEVIDHSREHGLTVEFTAEDAFRADREFLWEMARVAANSGASSLILDDPVGVVTPGGVVNFMMEAKERTGLPVGVSFSNDFGMAVANALAAAKLGASSVRASVHGLGPKAGIVSLEQFVTAIHALTDLSTGVDLNLLPKVSELVEMHSGVPVFEIAPVVGPLTFAYEAGVHVHAISSDPATYELLNPETVGRKRRIMVGKLSGKASVIQALRDLGYEIDEEKAEEILSRIKRLADEGVRITEGLLRAVADEALGRATDSWLSIKEWVVVSGSGITPTAQVTAEIAGRTVKSAGYGVGAVDALANALRGMEGIPEFKLTRFRLRAIATGTDALGEVNLRALGEGGETEASGISPDIMEATLKALEEAINRLKKG